MNPNASSSVTPSLIIIALLLSSFVELGDCRMGKGMKRLQKVGGIGDANDQGMEMESLAGFAVEEHNKKDNSGLKFVRLESVKEQVVGGMMYHLTLEASDGENGKINVYEAKVMVIPWKNSKQMKEFKVAGDSRV